MNKTFRSIWNAAKQAWVAAAEIVSTCGKPSSGAKSAAVATALLGSLLGNSAHAQTAPPANALPTGGQVSAGQASIGQSGANMVIHQSSERAAINWQTFNVGSNAQVQFQQPGASSVTLNRVLSSDPSQIFGRITANGQVILTNPAGVYFGASARVDVGGLVATTHSLSDADLMADNHNYQRKGSTASVVNEGEVKAALGGYIALLAPEVRNQGAVIAHMGTVALASGEAIELRFDANNRLTQLRVDPSQIKALVDNRHAVLAPGGLIILSAQSTNRLVGGLIQNSGRIEANGLQQQGGRIVLSASHKVDNSGSISANATSGASAADSGPAGQIAISAPQVINSGSMSATGAGASSAGSLLVQATHMAQTATGRIDLSAPTQGGNLHIQTTGSVQLQGQVDVSATQAQASQGGHIAIDAQGDIELNNATLDASGAQGGSVGLHAAADPQPNNPHPLPSAPDVPGQGRLAIMGHSVISTRGRQGAGGSISLLGDHISLQDTTALNASGYTGGGTVLVGGDWQGSHGTYQATSVTMAAGTSIDASATGIGNGGKVVLWSDVTNAHSLTQVAGSITAKGAGNGAGGQVETSGHTLGVADSTVVNTRGGLWLLDPATVTIDGSAGAVGTTNVGASVIASALGGNSVTISSTGWITLASSITGVTANTNTLTLQAGTTITQNANVAVNTNGGSVTYISNYGTSSGGGIVLNTGSSITTNGGAINLGSSSNYAIGAVTDTSGSNVHSGVLLYNSTLSAGTGAISIYGTSTYTAGDYGIGVWTGAGTTVIGGNITLVGNGSASNTNNVNYGVVLNSAALTASGNLSVTGTGGGTGASNTNDCGVITFGATLTTTGSGTITLTGTVGGGTVGTNNNYALGLNSSTFGSASQTGNVVLNGDSINFGSATTINTSGSVTIAPKGSSFYSALTYPMTNLTVDSRATGLTIGSTTNTANITIGSAVSINGPITVYGGNISVNAGLTSTASGAAINLQGTGWINQAANVAVSTNNGDVTYISNYGTSSGGGIVLNSGSSITTNGGAISLGKSDNYAIGKVTDTSGSTVYAGVLIYNSTLNAGTGAIGIYGQSTYTAGNNGIGVWFNNGAVSGGNITLIGYGSASNTSLSNYGVGLDGTTTLTASGNLSVTGTGGGTGASAVANRGVETNGATLKTTSGGTITLTGTVGNGTVGTNYNYALDINSSTLGGASQTGNVVLNGDSINFFNSTSTNTINTSGAVTIAPLGTSFYSALTYPLTNLTVNSRATGLTIGKTTNTANITIGSAVSINGPITVYGGNISVSAGLTSTASGAAINLQGTGWINQATNVAVSTNGGNVTYISNYGNNTTSAAGGIVLNTGSSITTNGGAINLGSSSNYAIGAVTDTSGSGVYAGVLLYSSTLNAGTGAIGIYGKSTYTAGNAGIGVWSNTNTVSGGDITLIGYGSAANTNNANYGVGLDGITTLTASGNLSVTGTGGGTGASNGNNRGIETNGATLKTTSGGTITLTGTVGNGTVGTNNNYALDLNSSTIGDASQTGNVVLNGDSINFLASSATNTINTSGTVTIAPLGTSFYSALTYPLTNLTLSSNVTGLAIGKASNTADITIGSATSIAGPITVYGGNITLSAGLTTTNAITGDVSLYGNVTGAGSISLANNRVLTITEAGTSSYSGIISGTGASLVKAGAGTLTLTGADTYTGNTTINAGSLVIGVGGSLGGGTYAGNISNAGTFSYNASTTQTLTGVMSGAGNLVVNGSGTLGLSNANTYSGSTTITSGTLQLNSGGTINNSSSITDNGTLAYNNAAVNTGALVAGTGSIAVGTSSSTGTTLQLTAALGVSGALTVYSGNVMDLNGYSSPNAISISGTGIANGGALINSSSTTASQSGAVTLLGASSVGGSGNLTISGALGDGGSAYALTKVGDNTLTLSATNTYTGATTVSNGTLQVGNGSAGTLASNSAVSVASGATLALKLATGSTFANAVADSGTLSFTQSGTLTVSGVVSGTGAVVQSGSGTTTLTNTNTYTGATTVSAGTLQVGNGSAGTLASNSAVSVASGATLALNLATGSTFANAVADSGTLSFTQSGTLTVSGVVSGGGAVLQSGSGTTTLTAANSYAGGSTVTAGVLKAGSVTALGSGAVTVNNGGMVDVNGQSLGNDFRIAGSAALSNSANTDVSLGGSITLLADASIRSTGTGALTLNGAIDGAYGLSVFTHASTYTQNGRVGGGAPLASYWVDTAYSGSTGNISLNDAVTVNGTMFFNGNDVSFANGLSMTNGSSTYQVSLNAAGKVTGTGNIALAGTSVLYWNQVGDSTYGGSIQGASATLLKVGPGKLVLTGANVYDQTQVSEGILQIGNGSTTGQLGTGSVLVDTLARLSFNRSDAITVGNTISGAGALSQLSGNSLTLTGVASYTGATEVTSGSLVMRNDVAPSTSGFTGAGTVAIEPASTAFTSSFTSAYSFASTLTGVRLGKADNTASVTLNSAIDIAGPISVYGGNINANANLSSTASGAAILLKATDSIVVAGGTTGTSRLIQTNNGDITLWADSDANASGRINLGNYVILNSVNGSVTTGLSGGGRITLAGGADNGANGGVASDGLPDGYAYGTADGNTTGSGIQLGTVGTTPASINNIKMYSGGGDIRLLGNSFTGAMSSLNQAHGIFSNGGLTMDSGTGAVLLDGKGSVTATGGYVTGLGLNFSGPTATGSIAITSAKASAQAITLNGSASSTDVSSYNLAGIYMGWGNTTSDTMILKATGVGGGISVYGSRTVNGVAAGNGLNMTGTSFLANGGGIALTAGVANTLRLAGGSEFVKFGAAASNTANNITLSGDVVDIRDSTNIDTTGIVTIQPTSNNFASELIYPISNLTLSSGVSGLTLGKDIGSTAHTDTITVSAATSIAGPITVYGGNIAINAGLVATGTNTITLQGSGTVTDGGSGYVSADKLLLLGGAVTLDSTSNAVGTLAASGVSSLTYVDSNVLTIGTVGATNGVSATGAVSIATQSGNLTVSQNVGTTDTSAAALVLNAGKSASPVTGTSDTSGNIVISGSPTITAGTGGTIKLFTGSVANSTGLASLASTGSESYYRYHADETTDFSTGSWLNLTSGKSYVMYREQPTVTVSIDNKTITYSDADPTWTFGLSGSSNSDSYVQAFASNPTVSVGGTTSTAGKYTAGTHTLSSSSSLTSRLGYAVSITSGTLTVNQKALTFNGTVTSRAYDGTRTATVSDSASGIVGSDVVTITHTGALYADKDYGIGKTVSVSGISLSSTGDSANYSIAATKDVTGDITKRTVTLSASKTYDGTTDLSGFVTLGTGVGSETLSYTGATASDAHVATANKYINAITLANATDSSGGLASNYQLPTLNAANAAVTISAKALTSSASITASAKDYDGTTAATGSTVSGSVSGAVAGDTISLVTSGLTLAYSDAHVATANKTISASGSTSFSIDGSTHSSVASDYSFTGPSIAAVAGTINAAALTPTLTNTGVSKAYDGTTDAPNGFAPSWSFSGLVSGDTAAALSSTGNAYDSKNVASASKVTVSGLAITGITGSRNSAASDYVLDASSKDVAATITARTVTVSGLTASSKTYDGTTAAIVSDWGSVSTGVGSETLGLSGASATFANANAGTGKTVTATGYTLANGSNGGLASNYQLSSTSATTTANIAQAALTVTANNDAKFLTQSDASGYAGVSYSGFVHGETENTAGVLTGALAISRTGGNTAAGTYNGVLVANGLGASNYSISYANGNYTIVPSNQLLVRVNNVRNTYGTATQYAISSVEYFNGSAVVRLDNGSVSGSSVSSNASNALVVNDGVGGVANFTLAPLSAQYSTANKLAVGNYQLGTIGLVTENSANFSNTVTVMGAHQVNAQALTASAGGGVSKVYDGTTNINGVSLSLATLQSGDVVTVNGTGAFASKNVGSSLSYTLSNLALSGADAANYYLSGGTNFSGNNGSITAKTLTVTYTGTNKVYDGGTSATVTASDDRISGDTLSLSQSAVFANKNAGTGKTINVSNIVLSGADASNYTLASTSGSTTANITPRTLTVGWAGQDKGYDQSRSATVTATDDRVAGDVLSIAQTALFDSANAGMNKNIAISGIALSGADSGNYVLASTSASATATITGIPVSVTLDGRFKVPSGDHAYTQVSSGEMSTVSHNDGSDRANRMATISVPFGSATLGTGFSVSLNGWRPSFAQEGVSVLTLADGNALPDWLSFDAGTWRLTAAAVPKGAFPLQLMLLIDGIRTFIVISERPI